MEQAVGGRGFLGEFELLVMLSVLQASPDAYGVPVRQVLERRTGRSVSRGALYVTLERLVEKGYLSATLQPGGERRGNRPRKYYRVERRGLRAIRDSRAAIRRMWRGLEAVLGDA